MVAVKYVGLWDQISSLVFANSNQETGGQCKGLFCGHCPDSEIQLPAPMRPADYNKYLQWRFFVTLDLSQAIL